MNRAKPTAECVIEAASAGNLSVTRPRQEFKASHHTVKQAHLLLLLLLLMLLPVRLPAGEPSAGMELQWRDVSPRGDILIEHYFNSKNYEREVWLAPPSQPSDRVLLYKHGRSVEVLFSPDQKWLVINDFPTSTDGAPFLFRRGQGLQYSPVANANIGDKVWRFAGKWHPLILTPAFGHRYVQVLRWANDSKAFLVAAFGHLDSPEKQRALDPWLCIFTLDDLGATLDLSLMNRGALHSHGGETSPRGPWR